MIFASRQFCTASYRSPSGSTKERQPVDPMIISSRANPSFRFNFFILRCAKIPFAGVARTRPALFAIRAILRSSHPRFMWLKKRISTTAVNNSSAMRKTFSFSI